MKTKILKSNETPRVNADSFSIVNNKNELIIFFESGNEPMVEVAILHTLTKSLSSVLYAVYKNKKEGNKK